VIIEEILTIEILKEKIINKETMIEIMINMITDKMIEGL
jgi:hypothetical protein